MMDASYLSVVPVFFDHALTVLVGLGLASTAGLRAFLPLLVVNLLALSGRVELGESFAHMGTWPATLLFGSAVVFEFLGDKFPGFDHLMDAFGTVIRPTAATVVGASMFHWMDPLTALAFGLIAGGTAAEGVQVVKAKARVVTSAFTGGLGNWAVSLGEDVVAFAGVVLAVVAPFLFAGAVAFGGTSVGIFFARRYTRARVAAARALGGSLRMAPA